MSESMKTRKDFEAALTRYHILSDRREYLLRLFDNYGTQRYYEGREEVPECDRCKNRPEEEMIPI